MTTIFADVKSGVMVCDSKCSDENTWYPVTKVRRVGDELVGYAGSMKNCQAWLKWYMSGKRGTRPKTESFQALSLRSTGIYEHSSDGAEILIERGFHGVGSGGSLAVAAFMAGAKPKQAVDIALLIDTGSGGEVHTHKLVK